ncbi:MAG TPA: hemin uptake protein HemP [Hyphomicrobium sp.]|nr:hemin uptake protein HemP [Hyphomicrobium sp.]
MKTAAEDHHPTSNADEPASTQHADRKIRILVSELLKGGREATLEHNGMDYRLRITANGKLILTK